MESESHSPYASVRVCTIYDNRQRPETTGEYVRRALGEICHVEHFHPGQIDEIPVGAFDLYLHVDDGLPYVLPPRLGPIAWWCIDTHLMYDWDVYKAEQFDWVFTAQRDGAERMRSDGVTQAEWLPLACDPLVHGKSDSKKEQDLCFVGNLAPGPRTELIELLRVRFPGMLVTRAYFTEMARIFSASRIVFNRSIRNDVNMRFFEAACAGSLLMTNDLTENGQDLLLQDGLHCATYRDADELLAKVAYYLDHEEERERIAASGRAEVLRAHTYRHRVEHILERCLGPTGARDPWSAVTTIVIAHVGDPALLRMAIGHIRAVIRDPYELIVTSDNTLALNWAVGQGARVAFAEGVADGWNVGASLALGRQVLFLDSATLGVGDWIGRLIYALRSETDLAACVPRFTGNVAPGARLAWPRDVERVAREMLTLPPPKSAGPPRAPTILARRTTLAKVGRFVGSNAIESVAAFALELGEQGHSVRSIDTTLVHILALDPLFPSHEGQTRETQPSTVVQASGSVAVDSIVHPIPRTSAAAAESREAFDRTIEEIGQALGNGSLGEAEDLLSTALTLGPEDALAHYLQGAVLVQSNRPRESLASFLIAAALEPTRPDFLNGVGVAYLELGENDSATAWFTKALSIDPANADARINLARLTETKARLAKDS